MKFSEHLWIKVLPIYERLIDHSFNRELAEGTLAYDKFIFYIEQDSYYLMNFSRAFALIAGRAHSSEGIHYFLESSFGALMAERELHAKFMPANYSTDHIEPSLACLAYTHYLIATAATAPLEEAIAATLPCLWIYREVGQNIQQRVGINNPYKLWIDTYSSEAFSDSTDKAIALLNRIANESSVSIRARMEKAFEYSSLLEWYFWEDAYNKSTFREGATKERAALFTRE